MKEKLSRIRKEKNSIKIQKGYGGTIMQEANREGKTLNRVQVLMRIVDKVDEVLEENGDCPEEAAAAEKWKARDKELHEVSRKAMRILQLRYKEVLLEDEIASFYKKQGEQKKERPQADTDRASLSEFLSMGNEGANRELQNLMKDVHALAEQQNEDIIKKQGKKIKNAKEIKDFFRQQGITSIDPESLSDDDLSDWIGRVENALALERVDCRFGSAKEIKKKLVEAKKLAESRQSNGSSSQKSELKKQMDPSHSDEEVAFTRRQKAFAFFIERAQKAPQNSFKEGQDKRWKQYEMTVFTVRMWTELYERLDAQESDLKTNGKTVPESLSREKKEAQQKGAAAYEKMQQLASQLDLDTEDKNRYLEKADEWVNERVQELYGDQGDEQKRGQKKGEGDKNNKDSGGDENGEEQLSPEEIRKREQESTLKKEQSTWNKFLKNRSPEDISQLLGFLDDSKKSLEDAERSILEQKDKIKEMEPDSERDLAKRYLRMLQENAASIREGIAEKELDIACRSVPEEVIREYLDRLKEEGKSIQKGEIIPESFYLEALVSNLEQAIGSQSALVESKKNDKAKWKDGLEAFRVAWDSQMKNLDENFLFDASDLENKRENEEKSFLEPLRMIEVEERKLALLQSQLPIARQRYDTVLDMESGKRGSFSWNPESGAEKGDNGGEIGGDGKEDGNIKGDGSNSEGEPDAGSDPEDLDESQAERSSKRGNINLRVLRLFERDFEIELRDLKNVPGFSQLSYMQQASVLGRLYEFVSNQQKSKATDDSKRRSGAGLSGALRSAQSSISEGVKRLRGTEAPERKRGISHYREALESFVREIPRTDEANDSDPEKDDETESEYEPNSPEGVYEKLSSKALDSYGCDLQAMGRLDLGRHMEYIEDCSEFFGNLPDEDKGLVKFLFAVSEQVSSKSKLSEREIEDVLSLAEGDTVSIYMRRLAAFLSENALYDILDGIREISDEELST